MTSNQTSATQGEAFLTSKGNQYSYRYNPPASDAPTLIFLHGFPSHKYDWLRQQEHFSRKGFGVLLVDLLGFGNSDAPDDLQFYHLRSMSDEIIEILDHIKPSGPVVGVGHDVGAMFLSRLATYHPERIQAVVYIAVGPSSMGAHFDADAINKFTKEMMGHEYIGYIPWIAKDPDAQRDLEEHAESAMKLLFCADHSVWDTCFRPLGAMKAFVTEDKDTKVGDWFDAEMQRRHLERYQRPGGYRGAVKWYQRLMDNLSLPEEAGYEGHTLQQPTLLIAPEQEAAQQAQIAGAWHARMSSESLACGHWVHLERADDTNKLIEDFVSRAISERES